MGCSGFSVSLYWPSGAMTEKVKPKRKRRCRKHPKASITNTVTDVVTSPSETSTSVSLSLVQTLSQRLTFCHVIMLAM